MNKEIKDKLRNAGFSIREDKWDAALYCPNLPHSIFIATSNGTVRIYANEEMNPIDYSFKDLEELNKYCYSTLHYDLDFEKKKYQWEDCLDTEESYVITSNCNIISVASEGIEPIGEYRNTYPTEKSALSGLAVPQLLQICKKINEDFKQDENGNSYYPCISGGHVSVHGAIRNEFPMNSHEALATLIETNLPLLKQYFQLD